jgi:arsenate reductase
MKEVGIDLSKSQPRKLTPELAKESALLVTMGCGEACPNVPGLKRRRLAPGRPQGKPVERVRQIRDDIRARVLKLTESMGCVRK